MSTASDEARRLQKALRARDKWQKKCEFEREVNLELARRIEHWKDQTQKEKTAKESTEKAFNDLYAIYSDLCDNFESLALHAQMPDKAAATLADIRRSRDRAFMLRARAGATSTQSSRVPSPSTSVGHDVPSHRSARSYSGVSHHSSDAEQTGTRLAKAASFSASAKQEFDSAQPSHGDVKDPLRIKATGKIKRRRSSVNHRRAETVDLASTITGMSGSSLHRHANSATTQGTSEDLAHASPIYNVDTLSFTVDGEEEFEEDEEDDTDVIEGVPLFEQFVVVGTEPAAAREAHMDRLIEFHSNAGLMKKFGRMLSKDRDSDAAEIRATAPPKVLFRYPNIATPLPDEICDFCQPAGAAVQQIAGQDTSTLLQDIMYGHGHTQRSPHCFVFQLTGSEASGGATEQRISEETGQNVGRLYGICVVHPRLIKGATVRDSYAADSRSAYPQHSPRRPANPHRSEDYEASVCYAFISRFPFFEFFFQVIWDMLSSERLQRMEAVALHGDLTDYDQQVYEYLPTEALRMIAGRLHEMFVPKYGGKLSFQVADALDPVSYLRLRPDPDMSEQLLAASEWALPTMFSWLPVPVLIWSLSLLLCEAKFVVVGQEPGLVSSVVFGLLSLLRPLRWVAPLIPVLPLKFLEFLESPVPILAGLVVEKSTPEGLQSSNSRPVMGAQAILRRARDSGSITAVLDVNKQDVFVATQDIDEVTNMLVYDAGGLYQRLDQEYTKIFGCRTPARETYTFSGQERDDMRCLYDTINKHMRGVVKVADHHLKHRDAAAVAPSRSSDRDSGFELSELVDIPKPPMPPMSSSLPPSNSTLMHSPLTRSNSLAYSRNSSHRSESESGAGEAAIIGLALEELTGDEHSFLEKLIATQMFDEHAANRSRKSARFPLPSPKHGKRVSKALTAPIEFTDAQLAAHDKTLERESSAAKELDFQSTIRSAASEESVVFANLSKDDRTRIKRRSTDGKALMERLSMDLRDGLHAGSSPSDHIAPADLYRRDR